MRITGSDYYTQDSLNEHRPGDVWQHFPTFGILAQTACCGVIVTPACDLDNCKTETLSYLPVVPVARYLTSAAMARRIKRELITVIGAQRLAAQVPPLLADDALAPNAREVIALERLIASITNELGKSKAGRANAGIELLKCISSGSERQLLDAVTVLFAKGYAKLIEDIVRNNRPDTHFLPSDGQPELYSAVYEHSVILLRYPLTVPLEIIEGLDSSAGATWKTRYDAIPYLQRCLSMFSDEPPLKRGRVREPFLKDILTRFTSVFARLGSPDFSPQLVSQICDEIEA